MQNSNSTWCIINKWKLLVLFPELMGDKKKISSIEKRKKLKNAVERHFQIGLTFLREVEGLSYVL